LAGGNAAAVDSLLTWLGHGPRGARVSGLDVDDSPSPAELENLEGFAIR
jgi:hypothetical protein